VPALILKAEQPDSLDRAADFLKNGRLVAFPTDTVYGLGANPFESEAVERIFEVKGRPFYKALVLLAADIEYVRRLAKVPPMAQKLIERFWPGALTLVLPRRDEGQISWLAGSTVAFRVPDHPVAVALLRKSGPLATTSANLSGQPETLTAQEAARALGEKIDLILDGGRCPGGVVSTVLDVSGERPLILRQGLVTRETIENCLKVKVGPP